MSQVFIEVDLEFDVSKITRLVMATNLTPMREGPPKHWTATREAGRFTLTCACAFTASETIKGTIKVPAGFRFDPPSSSDPRTRKFRFITPAPAPGIIEDFFDRPYKIVPDTPALPAPTP